MHIWTISYFEVWIDKIKILLTQGISKFIVDSKPDKNNTSLSPNSVNHPTLILSVLGMKELSSPVSNNLLLSCVSLRLGISVVVCVSPGMVSSFIVIALCMEYEMPFFSS